MKILLSHSQRCEITIPMFFINTGKGGGVAVAQLVEAIGYRPKDRRFDF